MTISIMRGYATLLERIMDKHPESFKKGGKSLTAYFSHPTSFPIRLQLLDNTLSEPLIAEVERYYDVTR